MTTNMKIKLKALWNNLADKSYRDAFVSEHIGSGTAVQIHEIRLSRGLTQKELGTISGMTQDRISKLESGDYGLPNLSTLARIASALECGLRVEFVAFSELAAWSIQVPDKTACVPSFQDDSPEAAGFGDWTSFDAGCVYYASTDDKQMAVEIQELPSSILSGETASSVVLDGTVYAESSFLNG